MTSTTPMEVKVYYIPPPTPTSHNSHTSYKIREYCITCGGNTNIFRIEILERYHRSTNVSSESWIMSERRETEMQTLCYWIPEKRFVDHVNTLEPARHWRYKRWPTRVELILPVLAPSHLGHLPLTSDRMLSSYTFFLVLFTLYLVRKQCEGIRKEGE